MRRFFTEKDIRVGERVSLSPEDSRHIVRVLRLGPGELLELSAPSAVFRCRILTAAPEAVELLAEGQSERSAEPPLELWLLQGMPKADKLEFVIQKAVELGAHSIVPLKCQRSIVRLEGAKAAAKRERWQKIAAEAAKQCRREHVPEVLPLLSPAEALAALPPDTLLLVPWEEEMQCGLRQLLRERPRAARVAVVIGPEGGLAAEEAALFRAAGGETVTLGPRILRTETAALAALSVLLYEWGDLGEMPA